MTPQFPLTAQMTSEGGPGVQRHVHLIGKQKREAVLPTTGRGYNYSGGSLQDQILSSPTSMNSSKAPSCQSWCQLDQNQYLGCSLKTSFISNLWSAPVPWMAGGSMLTWEYCKAPKITQRSFASRSVGCC